MDLDLEYCGCGRGYCDFFNCGTGEYGQSYGVEEVREFLAELPKIEKHIRCELAKYDAAQDSKESS